jgi:hypothetical protein
MVVGAFLPWAGGLAGTKITIPLFVFIALGQQGDAPTFDDPVNFFVSCGLAVMVLGVVAGLGILSRRAFLTKVGAGLATLFLIAFIVVMSGKRLDYGPFVCLFGSVLALAAGFMGTSKRR